MLFYHCFQLISTDVNFIASPPSMVAAGSVVAAVQGLYLKSQDASLSSENLTNFLSQVIRSDPVCKCTLFQINIQMWTKPLIALDVNVMLFTQC